MTGTPTADRDVAAACPPPSRATAAWTLLAILLLAAAVRCWRLGWGLDEGMSFLDERSFWESDLFAFLPPRWDSLFGHSMYYPTLYGYLVAVAVALAHHLGLIGPEHDVFEGLRVARAVSGLAGVATVGIVARIGWRFYGPSVGLLAAALMAAVPFEAIQTHYASSDVLLGTTSALTMLAACAFTADRRPLLAAAAGASAALAFCTKYNAGILLAAPLWVLLEVAVSERSLRRALTLGAATAAGFAAALVVACPPWLVESDRVLGQLRFMSTSGSWLPAGNHVSTTLGWYGRRTSISSSPRCRSRSAGRSLSPPWRERRWRSRGATAPTAFSWSRSARTSCCWAGRRRPFRAL